MSKAKRRRREKGKRPIALRDTEPMEPLDQWFYFGDYRMYVVGYTPGGAPYGSVERLPGCEPVLGTDCLQDEEPF